ncbi:MAG: leucine-rich repeat protein [Bacilli bacterium]|nr:leucine-rich repeat protein [Bacilli bacterium]
MKMSKLLFVGLTSFCLMISGCKNTEKPHEHRWGEATYTWSTDYSTCKAERVCLDDATHKESETATSTYEVINPAQCEIDGTGRYTASFRNTVFVTQTHDKRLAAIGHNWGTPTYTWSNDYSTCTAERICQNDNTHIERETVNSVFSVVAPASYEASGEGLFTATFVNPNFAVQTQTTSIAILDDLIFTPKNSGTEYSVKMKENITVDTIVIPNTYNSLPVTAIDNEGFAGNTHNVKKVVIPSSITTLDFYTFNNNPYIEEIDGLPTLYLDMFMDNPSLKKLVFANTFTSMSSNLKSSYVEEVVFPGLVNIPNYAFQDCLYLKHLTFGKNLNSIGRFAFLNTPNLESVIVDSECTKFFSDNGILYYSDGTDQILEVFPASAQIQSYTLVTGTTKIEAEAFYGTKYLEEVTLNNEFVRFGSSDEFYYAESIKRVVITNSSINLAGERIFTNCPNLEEVVFPQNSNYICQNGLILSANKATLYYVLGGYTGVVTIPKEVGTIKMNYAYRNVKCSAFEVESGSSWLCAEDGILMNQAKTQIYRYPCKSNETVITKNSFASTVTTIGQYAVSGLNHVTEIDLSGSSVSSCLFGAFSLNSALTKVTYPSTLTQIGAYQFSECANVTDIEFKMTKQDFLDNVTRESNWLSRTPSSINAIFTDVTVEIHTL